MNVLGVFKSLTGMGASSDNGADDCDRGPVARSGKGKPRKSGANGEAHWYDWVAPTSRAKALRPRVDEALKKLEEITE